MMTESLTMPDAGRHGRAHGEKPLETFDGIQPLPIEFQRLGRSAKAGLDAARQQAAQHRGRQTGQTQLPSTSAPVMA